MSNNEFNIYFEQSEKNIYITLLSKIINVSEIIKIQKKIRDIIACDKELKKIKTINKPEELRKIIKRDNHEAIIYQYPKCRIHASIVNIYTEKNLHTKCFNKRAEEIKNNLKDFIKATKGLEENVCGSLNDKSIDFWIKRIYLESPIKGSIALNIFPHSCDFFEKIEKTRKEFKYNTSIKAHPSPNYEYLVINIFRFIRGNKEYNISADRNFYEEIKQISDRLEKNPIKIQIKPRVVFSDKYFSNENYDL